MPAPVAPSWLYPFKGMWYFATHGFLRNLLRGQLIPCIILSIVVYVNLFVWAYLPQVAFLAIFQSKGAWLNATVLTLGEGAAVTALLYECFMADGPLLDTFDAVLVNEGHETLVSQKRQVQPGGAGELDLSPTERLAKPERGACYSPFSIRQIAEFIIFLPLNFVPWIGSFIFLWLTGYRAGPLQHHRYFELRDFTKVQKRDFIKAHRLKYTAFGCVQLALQLVPGLSIAFLFTTATGAALWASRLEMMRLGRAQEGLLAGEEERPPGYSTFSDQAA